MTNYEAPHHEIVPILHILGSKYSVQDFVFKDSQYVFFPH